MSKNENRPHKHGATNISGTADSFKSRDSPEQSGTEKTDSRGSASRQQRTSIGGESATESQDPQADNCRVTLPLVPGRDNSGRYCDRIDDDVGLPEHLTACGCGTHHGVCEACGYKITIGPSGREYGHARRTNSVVYDGDERCDCPHRPAECDPNDPSSKRGGRQIATDGGVSDDALQVAGQLRNLADDLEVFGLGADRVDVDVDGREATVVATVALEPVLRADGGDA